jgi:MFS family permease
VALGLADLCYFTGFGIAIFALPLYVTGPVGGGEALAGLAFDAFALSAFLLRPFVGQLSDLHGRRPFLVGGALLAALSLASLALTEDIVVILGLRLLAGVAEAAFFVAGFAALADVAPPARLGEALSYNSLELYLGIAFGPPLGEVLVRTFGFGLAWAGAAVFAVVAGGLCVMVGETRAGPPPDGEVPGLIHRPALPILVGFLASLLAMGGFLAFASLYGVRWGS